jgi:hypothetical protein
MDREVKFGLMPRRLLNIASIACLVACVALVGLWARSYRWVDRSEGRLSTSRYIYVVSVAGQVGFGVDAEVPRPNMLLWRIISEPAEQWIRDLGTIKWSKFWGCFELSRSQFMVPYWFLVFASGSLAMLFRLRWPMRFNLRNLFIATTFLAVVLGMKAWLVHPWIGK